MHLPLLLTLPSAPCPPCSAGRVDNSKHLAPAPSGLQEHRRSPSPGSSQQYRRIVPCRLVPVGRCRRRRRRQLHLVHLEQIADATITIHPKAGAIGCLFTVTFIRLRRLPKFGWHNTPILLLGSGVSCMRSCRGTLVPRVQPVCQIPSDLCRLGAQDRRDVVVVDSDTCVS